jgi:hypothetical protein
MSLVRKGGGNELIKISYELQISAYRGETFVVPKLRERWQV